MYVSYLSVFITCKMKTKKCFKYLILLKITLYFFLISAVTNYHKGGLKAIHYFLIVLEAMSLTSRSWLDSIPSGSFRGESIPSLFATSEAACITWMMVLPPSSRHIMAISCSFITSSFPAPGPPLSLR